MSRFRYLMGIFLAAFVGITAIGFSASEEKTERLSPIPMPLYDVDDNPRGGTVLDPQPIRDESVRKYLASSFRIRVPGAAGSGTLCYYDSNKNTAYVITCSHLFKRGDTTCTVEAFYKNDQKLSTPAQYKADILAFRENYQTYQGEDIAFIKFTPDWKPDNYYPIAPVNFPIPKDPIVSAGCDKASEVAAYMVKVTGRDSQFLITVENSPRPGRSGGGLLTKDGYYIGICVRTSDVTGNGRGFFVPLDAIHKYAKTVNLDFLLEASKSNELLRQIPIVDRNGPQGTYPPDYIPIP